MKRLQRTIGMMALLLLGVGVAAVQAQAQPQFSGNWVLDRSQSQFPAHRGHSQNAPDSQQPPTQQPPTQQSQAQRQPPQITLVVAQQGNTLKVTRTFAMGTRSNSSTDTIVADGTDQVQPGYHGSSVVTRSTFQGDQLIVTHTRTKKTDQGDQTMSRQSVWTLSPDGHVLTIETTMHSPRGDRAMKTVYQRS
jgi:hypothetical protein